MLKIPELPPCYTIYQYSGGYYARLNGDILHIRNDGGSDYSTKSEIIAAVWQHFEETEAQGWTEFLQELKWSGKVAL